MKKNALTVLFIMLCAITAKAQWSSMTIRNHSSCDYTVRLFADYGGGSCAYDNGPINITAGSVSPGITAPTYWDWACVVNPFISGGPVVPDAPTGWTGAPPCGGSVGTTADNWGAGRNEFNWRGALVYPAGAMPSTPGTNTGHPCGITHYVGDGFCGPQNPATPLHIWSENAATGDVTLDLY